MPANPQFGTKGYRNNDAIIPYGFQSSGHPSHRPRRKTRSHPFPESYADIMPIPSTSWSSPAYASTNYSSSPPLQTAPQPQTRAANAEGRLVRKYWCARLGCGRGYTLPQVLGRHVKDMHETKISCPQCLSKGVSFTYSSGRPYVYRKHVESKHPESVPPEGLQKTSRYAKESLNMGARQAQLVRPLTLSHFVLAMTDDP